MFKKVMIIISITVIATFFISYKLFYWPLRDYYYQLKYGAFMVDTELQNKDRLLYQASIKKLSPANLIAQIDSNYFIAPGSFPWERMPSVCPYTINSFSDSWSYLDEIGEGVFLTYSPHVNFTKQRPDDPPGSIALENDEYGELIEQNIIGFSFNNTHIIAKKRTDMKNGLPTTNSVTSYFIFEFATKKIKHFTTYKALMAEADSLNYKRHIFNLDYKKEMEGAKEYKEAERAKFLDEEETELIPFQLQYNRYYGMLIEI